MPTKVFGSKGIAEEKIDTSQFIQKLQLTSNYIEPKVGEDIDFKE